MTGDDFRRLALGFPEATEGAHMGHPDFRVRGKIFATLWTDGEWGVVLLKPEEQAALIEIDPRTYVPAKGAWGRQGSTQVRLSAADEKICYRAIGRAWTRIAPKKLVAAADLTFD